MNNIQTDADQSGKTIRTAMVMSAGLGKRMMPLTRKWPKPLIEVNGKALIDYMLDELAASGVSEVIANVHYRADQMERHLRSVRHPPIYISDERDELLETGGGLKKARPLLGDAPFFCANTDAIFCQRPPGDAGSVLRKAWRKPMRALLLLVPLQRTLGFEGDGDFHLCADGQIVKSVGEPAPYAFTGLQILDPKLLDHTPDGAFSTRLLWQKAAAEEALFGTVYDGHWLHVGTPSGVVDAEKFLITSKMITST